MGQTQSNDLLEHYRKEFKKHNKIPTNVLVFKSVTYNEKLGKVSILENQTTKKTYLSNVVSLGDDQESIIKQAETHMTFLKISNKNLLVPVSVEILDKSNLCNSKLNLSLYYEPIPKTLSKRLLENNFVVY